MTITIRLSACPDTLARVSAAIAQFTDGLPAGPMPRSVWLGEGFVELYPFNNRIHLAGIFVDIAVRRTGLGSQYLKRLLEAADAHQVEIECTVSPFGVQDPLTKMGKQSLKAWYRRHDFVVDAKRKDRMIRLPQNPSRAPAA